MTFAPPSEWKNPSENEYLHINYSRENNIWALWLNNTSANVAEPFVLPMSLAHSIPLRDNYSIVETTVSEMDVKYLVQRPGERC